MTSAVVTLRLIALPSYTRSHPERATTSSNL
jgi:hypothetical protein